MLYALYTLLQAAGTFTVQTVPKPFFTDDLEGWIKLGGMYVAGLGGLIAVIVRIAYNTHTKRLDDLVDQTNGVGGRIDAVKLLQTEAISGLSLVRVQMGLLDAKVDVHQRLLGEHDAQIAAYERTQHQLQSDIMGAIQEGSRASQNELHQINIKVARMEERERFGEALSEIASVLRIIAQK